MNTELTALTRPRISSGVASCTSDWRITTLTMSAAPDKASTASDSAKLVDRPNSTIVAPYSATDPSSQTPLRRCTGQRVSSSDITNAPAAGAARSNPKPQGPVCRMSRAKIGSSATAPPSSTANRSSETAPSTTGRCAMKRSPASSAPAETGSRVRGTARASIRITQTSAAAKPKADRP